MRHGRFDCARRLVSEAQGSLQDDETGCINDRALASSDIPTRLLNALEEQIGVITWGDLIDYQKTHNIGHLWKYLEAKLENVGSVSIESLKQTMVDEIAKFTD
jgi:hypothetical protein